MTMPDRPLDQHGRRLLADALGDTPETVISVHRLRRGLCRAYVAGHPARFDGAVIQGTEDPGEPTAFGADPEVLWGLLQEVRGWWCVNAAPAVAPALGKIIAARTAKPVRLYGDVYHTLTRPAPCMLDDAAAQRAARRLTVADLALLEAAPVGLRGAGFGSPHALLADGVVAGTVAAGGLVAVAYTSAVTGLHADIAVSTLDGWRGRGLATAAASLVARGVRETGRVPVWSVGEGNTASLRVARKLGFAEVLRRAYVIPDG